MSSSPFSNMSCPTDGKHNKELRSKGWIDSTGTLVATHDATTAHLGAPWRMPTSDELKALVENCTTEWIATNGVSGCLVTGKGEYANRSIFLPGVGYGDELQLSEPGSSGCCWSSASASSHQAWNLDFDPESTERSDDSRYYGQSVRLVRYAG